MGYERQGPATDRPLPGLGFGTTVGDGNVAEGATQVGYSFGDQMHGRIMPRRAARGASI